MLFFRKNFLKSLMSAQLQLPEPAWRAMNWSWSGFNQKRIREILSVNPN